MLRALARAHVRACVRGCPSTDVVVKTKRYRVDQQIWTMGRDFLPAPSANGQPLRNHQYAE